VAVNLDSADSAHIAGTWRPGTEPLESAQLPHSRPPMECAADTELTGRGRVREGRGRAGSPDVPSTVVTRADGARLPESETAGWAQDTIVAISTAVGPGAIGIVRMSGPDSLAIAQAAFRPARGESLRPEENYCLLYGHVFDPAVGQDVDEALMAVMRAPRSYTREDVVELHCHGGLAAQRAVLRLMVRLGARPAEPGEFTKRAFLNGRIDLAQAESVAAIVAARSSGALRVSLRQLEGGLSTRLCRARHHLVDVLAQVEATVDFSDEDIDPIDWEALAGSLEEARDDLEVLLSTALLGRALEQGARTAIVGRPNVGKSSLLNALLMRERAIVSDVPGTTRDTVEELMEIGGIPIHLVDTAGIRASLDKVEQLGVERSIRAMEQADLVLAVIDLAGKWTGEDRALLEGLDPARTIIVANKADLVADPQGETTRLLRYLAGPHRPSGARGAAVQGRSPAAGLSACETGGTAGGGSLAVDPGRGWKHCTVSALSGDGLDLLRSMIQDTLTGGQGLAFEEPVLANERQVTLVSEALEAVKEAVSGAHAGRDEELICEDLRAAIQALGRITGEDLTADLLDEIFARFCIGK